MQLLIIIRLLNSKYLLTNTQRQAIMIIERTFYNAFHKGSDGMEISERRAYRADWIAPSGADEELLPGQLRSGSNAYRRSHCLRALEKAMKARLNPEQRRLLHMHYTDGLSKSEIARLESRSCSSVCKIISAARRSVKDYTEMYMEIFDSLERDLRRDLEA
jgi:DNA-directed RNA polymerase specialized sigma24 family protein